METALFDPVVVSPAVDNDTLRELLRLGRESAKLDYKRQFNPSDTAEKVGVAKDIIAMTNTAGGYIVIGVTDAGEQLGIAAEEAARIDEAVVRAQVAGYTSARIPLFVHNQLAAEGRTFVVITVIPVVGDLAVVETIGNRPGAAPAFRPGEVLVRHGSASEVWNQADVDFVFRRATERRKEEWLRDFGSDFRRIAEIAGVAAPAPLPSYDQSAEDFQRDIIDMLRRPNG